MVVSYKILNVWFKICHHAYIAYPQKVRFVVFIYLLIIQLKIAYESDAAQIPQKPTKVHCHIAVTCFTTLAHNLIPS